MSNRFEKLTNADLEAMVSENYKQIKDVEHRTYTIGESKVKLPFWVPTKEGTYKMVNDFSEFVQIEKKADKKVGSIEVKKTVTEVTPQTTFKTSSVKDMTGVVDGKGKKQDSSFPKIKNGFKETDMTGTVKSDKKSSGVKQVTEVTQETIVKIEKATEVSKDKLVGSVKPKK